MRVRECDAASGGVAWFLALIPAADTEAGVEGLGLAGGEGALAIGAGADWTATAVAGIELVGGACETAEVVVEVEA